MVKKGMIKYRIWGDMYVWIEKDTPYNVLKFDHWYMRRQIKCELMEHFGLLD